MDKKPSSDKESSQESSQEAPQELSIEEQVHIKAGQARRIARYMSSTQDMVEEQIRKAREKGAFDNLAGSGQPLNLEENPFEPPELRMVFKILKNNDYAPYWIEIGKDIDAEFDKVWQEVERFERYIKVFFSGRQSEKALVRFERKKELLYMEQERRLEKLYMRVVDYNLHCPTFREGRANLDVAKEMRLLQERVEARVEESRCRHNTE